MMKAKTMVKRMKREEEGEGEGGTKGIHHAWQAQLKNHCGPSNRAANASTHILDKVDTEPHAILEYSNNSTALVISTDTTKKEMFLCAADPLFGIVASEV